mgnify:FL=1
MDWIVLILAIAICAYTGFLISALIRFPLINTAVLPALFVASGFSAGCAATKVLAAWLFGADRHGSDLHVLHAAEWPIMAVEALCLLMIIIALVSGNAAAQAAFAAFTSGMWAQVFWVGAVGIGFLIPLALSFFGSKAFRTGATAFYTSGLAAICGMMCLRLFIIYAGQINSI